MELIILFLLLDLLRLLPFLDIYAFLNNNWIGFAAVVVLIGGMMIYGNIHYNNPKRTEIDIATRVIAADSVTGNIVTDSITKNVPLKIVFASDLHIGYNIDNKEIEKWVSLINKENPDIILFGGDIVDNSTRPLEVYGMAENFKKLKARYGVFGVLGNHEYISQRGRTVKNSTDPTYKEIQSAQKDFMPQKGSLPKVEQFYREAGIMLLQDTAVNIDNKIVLVGRDDYSNVKRNSLSNILNIIPDSVKGTIPVILLDHQPHNLNEATDNGVVLQLSGHTHAGQLIPVSLITPFMYENNYGLLIKDKTAIYVTSGLGIWGGKFRIGTSSEYVVIKL
jgi:predicted MPP superfamily phosphohydrolase